MPNDGKLSTAEIIAKEENEKLLAIAAGEGTSYENLGVSEDQRLNNRNTRRNETSAQQMLALASDDAWMNFNLAELQIFVDDLAVEVEYQETNTAVARAMAESASEYSAKEKAKAQAAEKTYDDVLADNKPELDALELEAGKLAGDRFALESELFDIGFDFDEEGGSDNTYIVNVYVDKISRLVFSDETSGAFYYLDVDNQPVFLNEEQTAGVQSELSENVVVANDPKAAALSGVIKDYRENIIASLKVAAETDVINRKIREAGLNSFSADANADFAEQEENSWTQNVKTEEQKLQDKTNLYKKASAELVTRQATTSVDQASDDVGELNFERDLEREAQFDAIKQKIEGLYASNSSYVMSNEALEELIREAGVPESQLVSMTADVRKYVIEQGFKNDFDNSTPSVQVTSTVTPTTSVAKSVSDGGIEKKGEQLTSTFGRAAPNFNPDDLEVIKPGNGFEPKNDGSWS